MDEHWQDWFEERNIDPARDVLRTLLNRLDDDNPFIDANDDHVLLIASKLARVPSSWVTDPTTVGDRAGDFAIAR